MFRNRYFWLLISLFFVLKTEAKVTLTSIWGDNMVLQQQAEVTFRGRLLPENVYMLPLHGIIGKSMQIVTGTDNGHWLFRLRKPADHIPLLFRTEKS